MYYELTGDEHAQMYFYVDPDLGTISLKQSVLNDDEDTYEVCSVITLDNIASTGTLV